MGFRIFVGCRGPPASRSCLISPNISARSTPASSPKGEAFAPAAAGRRNARDGLCGGAIRNLQCAAGEAVGGSCRRQPAASHDRRQRLEPQTSRVRQAAGTAAAAALRQPARARVSATGAPLRKSSPNEASRSATNSPIASVHARRRQSVLHSRSAQVRVEYSR